MVDFLVFELGDSPVVSVDSLADDLSLFASDLSDFRVLLFFSLEVLLLVLFEEGLVAVSAAGLFIGTGLLVVDDLVAGAELDGDVLAVALVAGVIEVAAEAAGEVAAVAAGEVEAAGVMLVETLAEGLALALVEAALFVVVPVVVVPVVVALVAPVVLLVTPNVLGTVTP